MIPGKEVYKTALLISIASFALCSCSSTDTEPEAVEVPITSNPIDDAPETVLFERGKRLFLSGHYIVARDAFESLKNSYPLSPYAEFAEIKLADSDFELKKYLEAGVQYESLIKSRPSSHSRNYLLVMAARSYQLANRGVGRDTEPLTKAQQFSKQALNEFPGSPYEKAAIKILENVDLLLAENQAAVARFYQQQEKTDAYRARVDDFEKRWGTRDLDEFLTVARATPTEAETAQTPDKAKVYATKPPAIVLAAHTTSDVLALAPAKGHDISEARASLALGSNTGSELSAPGAQAIERVECKNTKSGQMLAIYLRSEPAELDSSLSEKLSVKDGSVLIPLGARLVASEFSCGEDKTVSALKSGIIKVAGTEIPELMTLNHPPRLLLSFSEKN